MKISFNVVAGLLGAAGAGMLIGMLIAPKKGEEFRSDLKKAVDDLGTRLGDIISEKEELNGEVSKTVY